MRRRAVPVAGYVAVRAATLAACLLVVPPVHADPRAAGRTTAAPPAAAVEARRKAGPEATPAPAPPVAPVAPAPLPPAPPAPPAEGIEVDVSTRTVAVTSAFSGTEIVVFGSVDNSRQQSAESGYYDVVVVVEGASAPAIVREKTRLPGIGIWVNTSEMRFDLPLYRAIASTRPIEEVAEPTILRSNGISFDKMFVGPEETSPQRQAFKTAAIRLKKRDGLYVKEDFGVAFIGRSLFRAGVKLPANIPVGPLDVRVHLFKDGRVLATRAARVRLERRGLERLIYDFAYEAPVWYGLLAVAMAAGAGLLASAVFRRQTG